MSPLLLAAAALAASPELVGDPLTDATQGAFEGPVALIAAPTRLATEAPEPWAGIGVTDAPLNPGPVGWALLRKGRTTWSIAAGYGGAESEHEAASIEEGYFDDTGTTGDLTTTDTWRSDGGLLDLGVAVGRLLDGGWAWGLSLLGSARWAIGSLDDEGDLGTSSWSTPGAGDRGEHRALDLDATLGLSAARVGGGGSWLAGLTGSFVRATDRIELESGTFDERGDLVTGTTTTGYPLVPLDDAPDRLGIWPGARFAVDRGGAPGGYRWRFEIAGRGGLLSPGTPERTAVWVPDEDYAYLGPRVTTITTRKRRAGAGFDGTVALWHGSDGPARVREGLVLTASSERQAWTARTTRTPDPWTLPPAHGEVGDLALALAIPIALSAPCSERVSLDVSLTPGFELLREWNGDDAATWDATVRSPWLDARAGLTWRALDAVSVHGLVGSSAPSSYVLVGGSSVPQLPASDRGRYGVLPLTASLLISAHPGRSSASSAERPAE